MFASSVKGNHRIKNSIAPVAGVFVVVYTNSIWVSAAVFFVATNGEKNVVSSVVGSFILPAALSIFVIAAATKPFFTISEPALIADKVVPELTVIAGWAVWSFKRR